MITNMRIAYFAEIFPSQSETWVHHEITYLANLGHRVRVFAKHARPTSLPDELAPLADMTVYLPEVKRNHAGILRILSSPDVMRTVATGWFDDCPTARLRAQVLRDIFHAGWFLDSVLSFAPGFLMAHFGGTRANLALICSRLLKIPFGVKFHGFDVYNRVALLRSKFRYASVLSTISNFSRDFMREAYGDVDASRIEIHKCGIALSSFPFQPKETRSERLAVVAVGRLVREKAFHHLIQASRILLDQGLPHDIKIYGEGPERGRLERMIDALGLAPSVRLMGYGAPTKIRESLSASDLFVLPSVSEGLPVCLLEAMAVGIPVIGTRITAIPELILDGVNGYLCRPNDPADLADAIVRFVGIPDAKRLVMIRRARESVGKEHDIATLSRLWEQRIVTACIAR